MVCGRGTSGRYAPVGAIPPTLKRGSRSRASGGYAVRSPSTIRPLVFDTSVIIFLAFLSLGDDAPHLLPGVLVNERVFGMRRKAPLTGSRCGFSFFWRLLYSVLKKAFWCTEWTCGVKTGLLRYATRFQRHSVQKTGSCGTEGIFGTRNPLLRYAMHLQCANSFQYNT